VRLGDGHAERRHAGERGLEGTATLEVDAEARDRHKFHRRVGVDALVVEPDIGEVTQEARIVVLLLRFDDQRRAAALAERSDALHQ
jgi:hypothetical protein